MRKAWVRSNRRCTMCLVGGVIPDSQVGPNSRSRICVHKKVREGAECKILELLQAHGTVRTAMHGQGKVGMPACAKKKVGEGSVNNRS